MSAESTRTGFKNFRLAEKSFYRGDSGGFMPSGLFHLCDTPSDGRHVVQHIYLFRSLISFFRIWLGLVPFLVSASMKFLTRQLRRYGLLEFREI
jgi:hypothetical protein